MYLFAFLVKTDCILNKKYENTRHNAKHENEKCRLGGIERDLREKKDTHIYQLDVIKLQQKLHLLTRKSSGWICRTHCGFAEYHLFRSLYISPCSNVRRNLEFKCRTYIYLFITICLDYD